MIPLKWKIYRVLNYVLLVASSFIFLKIFEDLIRISYDFMAILISLTVLFLIIQSIINLTIMAKAFPGKVLTGAKKGWHLFSTIMNSAAFIGITYAFINMVTEIDDYAYSQYKSLIQITVLIFLLLLAAVLFILICQFT